MPPANVCRRHVRIRKRTRKSHSTLARQGRGLARTPRKRISDTPAQLIAPAASTGRVLDVLYLMRRLEDVSPLVPPPSGWATSGVPMLAEAIAFIEELVNNSAGFRNGPDGEADDWKSVRNKIAADDGSINYDGIEQSVALSDTTQSGGVRNDQGLCFPRR